MNEDSQVRMVPCEGGCGTLISYLGVCSDCQTKRDSGMSLREVQTFHASLADLDN